MMAQTVTVGWSESHDDDAVDLQVCRSEQLFLHPLSLAPNTASCLLQELDSVVPGLSWSSIETLARHRGVVVLSLAADLASEKVRTKCEFARRSIEPNKTVCLKLGSWHRRRVPHLACSAAAMSSTVRWSAHSARSS